MRGARGLLAIAIALAACGGGGRAELDAGRASPAIEPEHAEVGGRVVSTVDGSPITRGEIEEVARATGLAPLDALRRLQEERVLAARADRAGLGDDREVRDAERRAAVRALLADRIEREIGEDAVPAAEIAARYEAERARFARPERRRGTHVLARVPEGAPPEAEAAAERFVRGALERLSRATDPVAEAHAIQSETTGRTFTALVEDLPPVSRTDAIAPEFLDALFSMTAPGPVPRPVRTRFGWHAIVLVEILPPWEAPREEAEDAIRDELLTELRARRLDELVGELASRTTIARDEAAIERVADADLEGGP